MLIGCLAVIIFMIVYYRLSGIVANFALVLNIVLLLAVLAGFRRNADRPGLAGIVLTIGMAVDANVLIYERIREELRNGKTLKACYRHGLFAGLCLPFSTPTSRRSSRQFFFSSSVPARLRVLP